MAYASSSSPTPTATEYGWAAPYVDRRAVKPGGQRPNSSDHRRPAPRDTRRLDLNLANSATQLGPGVVVSRDMLYTGVPGHALQVWCWSAHHVAFAGVAWWEAGSTQRSRAAVCPRPIADHHTDLHDQQRRQHGRVDRHVRDARIATTAHAAN